MYIYINLYISYFLGWVLLVFSFIFIFFSIRIYFLGSSLFFEWCLFRFNRFDLIILLLFDWLRCRFISLVILIRRIVIFYRSDYILKDYLFKKFIILVFLFVMSILLLILSPNMIRVLLGWDGLGLVSYCLVIFYENDKSSSAGILTILSNRIGDILILLSIALIIEFGSWNIFYLQMVNYNFNYKVIFFIVLLSGITKRAQIPFSAWLPAAMAAPTPVSSLVHSSTLVTAGVYLLIRFDNFLELKYFLFCISLLTILMSGVSAIFETDLKRVIALSTLSQLGVIIMTLSFGYYEIAFFHLLSHALFKSLLFLCAGSFIHGGRDFQDSRFIGSIWVNSPIIIVFFIISSLRLCGFPFISGFYSKDLILEIFIMNSLGVFIFFLIILSTFMTFIYSIRLFYLIRINKSIYKNIISYSDRLYLYYPISILFIFSIIGGTIIIWLYFPLLYIYLSLYFRFITLFLCIISIFLLNFLLNFFSFFNNKLIIFYVLGLIWNLPILSTNIFSYYIFKSYYSLKNFDQGWGELFGPQGTFVFLSKINFYLDLGNIFILKKFFFISLLIFIYILFFFYIFYCFF